MRRGTRGALPRSPALPAARPAHHSASLRACRQVHAAGGLAGKRADELRPDADAGKVRATVLAPRQDFWYAEALRRRWVIDPCEWDAAYAAGVATLEVSIAEFPHVWDMAWVWAHTSRCAAAARLSCPPQPPASPAHVAAKAAPRDARCTVLTQRRVKVRVAVLLTAAAQQMFLWWLLM